MMMTIRAIRASIITSCGSPPFGRCWLSCSIAIFCICPAAVDHFKLRFFFGYSCPFTNKFFIFLVFPRLAICDNIAAASIYFFAVFVKLYCVKFFSCAQPYFTVCLRAVCMMFFAVNYFHIIALRIPRGAVRCPFFSGFQCQIFRCLFRVKCF